MANGTARLGGGTRYGARALLAVVAAALITALAPAPAALATGDDYPWRADQSSALDSWGFTRRQCVSFAAWRAASHQHPIHNNGWGDAAHWDAAARNAGMTISTRPKPGAIAQWRGSERTTWVDGGRSRYYQAGAHGHVAWVSGVYANGLVRLESYNATGTRSYTVMTARAPRYIYLS
ncbi:MAG: CHAP domain-containing protein [Frankia sp.]|nr:CHAP domain-containing protein [Frankia sp.]